MKKFIPLFIIIGAILLVVILYFVFYTESASEETVQTNSSSSSSISETSTPNEAPDTSQANSAGYYVSYEDYQSVPGMYNDGKIVYFFNADWCPTCKALDNDIIENGKSIPAGVSIVSVDYDEYTDLKRQYGVTYQHTLVQVDADGNQIKKWNGGNTLDSVLQQI